LGPLKFYGSGLENPKSQSLSVLSGLRNWT